MTPDTTIPADLIERERAEFEPWYLANAGDLFCLLPDLFCRMISDSGEYAHLGPRVAFRAWLACASRPVEVTEEMVEIAGNEIFPGHFMKNSTSARIIRKAMTASLKGAV